VTPTRARKERPKPPFLIGVATSGYQIEGGFNGEGEPHNNWALWERTGRAARSGVAAMFWEHPEEALDRAASLGCNAFRLSVEWARLEPQADQFDQAALERYGEILSMCQARGLVPIVTLHHFTHPWWLGEEFWLRPASPERFARHVERVVAALSPLCGHWVTINEPNIVMLMGWIEGSCPPGRRMAVSDAYCVLDNMLTAHVLATDVIAGIQPDAVITCNTSASSIYEHYRLLTDLLLLGAAGIDPTEVDRYVDERRAMHDALFPPQHLGELLLRRYFAAVSPYGTANPGGGRLFPLVRSRARRPATRRVVEAVQAAKTARPIGPIGFDFYDPVASRATRWPGYRDGQQQRVWSPGREIWDVPADPPGLLRWCRDTAAFYPEHPLWVVENGMATRVREDGRSEARADGWQRPRFIREYLDAVGDAVERGAPVQAYLHWSLVDNYEWGSYQPRLGLFGMERSSDGSARWLDTDAQGLNAPGEFARSITALRSRLAAIG
jgi:beta-glucosidase